VNEALQTLSERGFVAQCTDIDGLSDLLDRGPVPFYVGIDPTGSSLHIGHIVPLYALAHLARAGHLPVVLIGAGTAMIGDPSGKSEMRQMITREEIEANVVTVQAQVERFLAAADVKPTIANNADWLTDLNYISFLRDIGRHFSVNRMLTFEAYRIRMESGLSFLEFNYQLLQSYDFLKLHQTQDVLLQIGGDDQWGNIVAGADLIRRVEGAQTYGLTFPLIMTADGKKMGKTEAGSVFLDSSVVTPYEMYQYWRNVADADVERFLLMFTFLPIEECRRLGALQGSEANQAKEVLAYEATALIHGSTAATEARATAKSAFGSASLDASAMPSISLEAAELAEGVGVVELFAMTDLCSSLSDARRLVTQGGARVNDVRIDSIEQVIDGSWVSNNQIVLRAGKKRFFRIIVT
jgi:tyrosyl-tRNA synthetase